MMEINILSPEQIATVATYKNMFRVAYYESRGILCLYSAQCLLVRQRIKRLMLLFSIPKCNFAATV